jgi:predicted acyltransferase (DUF342 family)
MSQYEEILEDLEESFNEGKIDYNSYQELKQLYTKKIEEENSRREKTYASMKFKAMGCHSVSEDTLTISGAARLPGGLIPKRIRVSGTCKIGSNIECNGLKCSGTLRSKGSILSHGNIVASGALCSEGMVTVEKDVSVSGSARVFSDLNVTGLTTVSGSMRCKGNVDGKGGIKISGRGKVDGSLISETEVDIKGFTKIGGNLVAERVKIKAPHEIISVFRRILLRLGRSIIEGSIVGNELVDIENILVEGGVKGRIVKIGANSKIEGPVEYVEDLILADNVDLKSKPVQVSAHTLTTLPQHSEREGISRYPTKKTPITMFCAKCGQEVGVGRKFCAACGSELS